MSGDPTRGDGLDLDRDLAERLHAAADRVEGRGVTRAGVAEAAARRQRRQQGQARGVLLGVAAAVLVVAGLLAVLRPGRDGADQLRFETPATATTCPALEALSAPAGWFRLTAEQASVLRSAGAITASEAEGIDAHAVLLTHQDLLTLSDPVTGPLADQVEDLGYEDAAGLALLRDEGQLTPAQQDDIDARIAPVLDQEQVDRVFAAFPDLQAVVAGGQPFPTGTPEFAPSGPIQLPVPPSVAGCATTTGG